MRPEIPRLFLVTNDQVVRRSDFLKRAELAMRAAPGCGLQLRAHGLSTANLWQLARQLHWLAWDAGASLWINDRIDVALAVRAEGVQLGVRSLPTAAARQVLGTCCRVGRSVHDVAEAVQALGDGADMVMLGNVFATASHPGRRALGVEALRRAAKAGRPIVAIGGITPERVPMVVREGAWGVGALSGVWSADDVAAAARRFVTALEDASRP